MKILGTLTLTDPDLIVLGSAAGVLLGWAALCYMRGVIRAWREDKPPEFTFRSIENLGPTFVGGDNPWHGCLVTDCYIDATTGEQLRAAVERYQSRYAKPRDGDRFVLLYGELVKL